MNPKVLTVFPSPACGGAERLVLDQMRGRDPAAYDLAVVALRAATLDREYQSFPDYHCLRAGIRINPLALAALNRIVRSRRISILHTHLQEADFYGYWVKRWTPALVWVSTRHNTDPFRARPFWRRLNRAMARRMSRIVAVSHAVRDFVARHEGAPPEQISVIHNGVDPTRFAAAASPAAIKRSLGIDESRFVIGIAGRITRQKGHRYLFEAVARIASAAPDFHVLVVGTGALERRLRSLACRLGIAGRVTFAGFRQDMGAMYTAMDAFCMPSLYEGFGLTFVEAMLCERLVIGTNVDGIKEIVEPGVTGLLVPPADSEALANTLLRIRTRDHDAGMAARGRQKALAEFDLRKHLQRLETLYRDLTAEGRPAD